MPLNDYQLGGTVVIRGAKFAARQLGKVWKVSKKVWKGFQKIARIGMRVMRFALRKVGIAAIGLTGIMTGAIKVWADFTLQMAKVGTLLDDGRDAMRRFGGEVRRLSMETGQSTEVVSEGLFQALSAGVSAADATKFMGVAAEAGVAGFTDLNVAVDGLTNVLNAYGLSAGEARKVSDAFFTANKFGKTTFQELASFMGTAAPMAAALGISYKDLLASIISITKAGVSTDKAFTQLSGIMTSLVSTTPKLSKAVRKQLGLTFGPEAIKEYGGFTKFMEAMGGAVAGNVKTFRKLFPNVRAFRGALRLTSETGMREMVQGLAEIEKGGGITANKFKEVSATLGFQFKQLKQVGVEAFRSLGEAAVKGLGIDLKKLVARLRGGLPRFKAAATEFFSGLREGFASTWPEIKTAWKNAMLSMGTAGETLFRQLNIGFGNTQRGARGWGRTIGKVIGQAITQFGKLITKVDALVTSLINALNTAKTAWGFFTGRDAVNAKTKRGGTVDPTGKTGPKRIVDKGKVAANLLDKAGAVTQLPGQPPNPILLRKFNDARDTLARGGDVTPAQLRALGVHDPNAASRLRAQMKAALHPPKALALRTVKLPTLPTLAQMDMRRKLSDPKELAKLAGAKGKDLLARGKAFAQGHGIILSTLGKTIADAVGERPWELFFKMENKTEVDNGDGNLDLGGGGSGSVDHHERGAGSAIAEFRYRQKYLVTEGAIRSVPHEFIAVKGSGASGGAALL